MSYFEPSSVKRSVPIVCRALGEIYERMRCSLCWLRCSSWQVSVVSEWVIVICLYSNYSARWTPKGQMCQMWQVIPCSIPEKHVWYWFLFSIKRFSEQFGWAAPRDPNLLPYFWKTCFQNTVLRNKTKRAKNWTGPGKKPSCHNCYRQGVLSLHRIRSTKPFLIAVTLIHKLQDLFTFVLASVILCCFNSFRSNYG